MPAPPPPENTKRLRRRYCRVGAAIGGAAGAIIALLFGLFGDPGAITQAGRSTHAFATAGIVLPILVGAGLFIGWSAGEKLHARRYPEPDEDDWDPRRPS